MSNLKHISFPKEQSKELIEFLGAHWGDGCLQHETKRNNYVWRIFGNLNKDGPYLDYVSRLITSLFSISPKKHITHKRNVIYLEVYSKKLLIYFRDELYITVGKKMFLETNRDYIENSHHWIEFTRGLFDTDGCVTLQKCGVYRYKIIKISNKDYSLLSYINKKLHASGFHSFITIHRATGCYQLVVRRKKEIEKWKNTIGSNNPRNLEKLDKLI